jgi:basic membrane protein A and related proteins
VRVVWTNTWFDPAKERAAAEALLDGGADVIAQHQDTAGPQQAAEERGLYGIGYNADMAPLAPEAVITSVIWHWGPYYIDIVESVMDGTWKSEQFWGGWPDGIVDLAPIADFVPDDIRAPIEEEIARFKSGEETVYTIFTGPIADQTGEIRVPEGQSMTDEELLSMNWFVEGVEGEIPT